jgi:inhibitor of growth protein 3
MGPPRTSNQSNHSTAYALSLLSEYTYTLDSLPLDLSRTFADLRELDAVLSSSLASITSKIHTLTRMIEDETSPKEERLWLLNDIAEEAARLKPGGEDKIRVACQAADTLKAHSNHLRALLDHIPAFNAASLDRHTTYPHVAPRAYIPTTALESGRRRRGGFSSLLMSAPEHSPAKRKRAPRDDDAEAPRSPRKELPVGDATSQRPRNGTRPRRCVQFFVPIRKVHSCSLDPSVGYPQQSPSYL